MRAELKQRWIEALRSDRYRQARGHLRHDTPSGRTHCAMGVLYDLIATPEQWARLLYAEGGGFRHYCAYLPIESFDDTRVSPLVELRIAGLNDQGATFAQIADVIERDIEAEPDLVQYVSDELTRIAALPRRFLHQSIRYVTTTYQVGALA